MLRSTPEFSGTQWQALIPLHRTLLHEHHDFFLASQHPSASAALRLLAEKYAMPARMWRHGIHSLLDLLRQQLPGLGLAVRPADRSWSLKTLGIHMALGSLECLGICFCLRFFSLVVLILCDSLLCDSFLCDLCVSTSSLLYYPPTPT